MFSYFVRFVGQGSEQANGCEKPRVVKISGSEY